MTIARPESDVLDHRRRSAGRLGIRPTLVELTGRVQVARPIAHRGRDPILVTDGKPDRVQGLSCFGVGAIER